MNQRIFALILGVAQAFLPGTARADVVSLPAGSIALEWLDAPALSGGPIGHIKKGLVCLPAGAFHWRAGDSDLAALRLAVQSGLDQSGPPGRSEQRFQRSEEHTSRFRLGATIAAVDARICKPHFPGYKSSKGKITAVVEWALYDTVTKTVSVQARTEGIGSLDSAELDGPMVMMTAAVRESLHNFLNKPEVQKALVSPAPPAAQKEQSRQSRPARPKPRRPYR